MNRAVSDSASRLLARSLHLRIAIASASLLVGSLGPVAESAAASSPCVTYAPSGASYSVLVCITSPGDGSTLTADRTITATASTTGSSTGIRRMTFYLDGSYLLTDYQAPYSFTLPSAKFVDGPHTLEAEVWMRDGNTATNQHATVDVVFSNGVTSPPINGNTWTDKLPSLAASEPFVVAAAGDGAGGEQSETDTTGLIASWNPSMFLYLGDVYEKGSVSEFYNWYGSGALAANFYGRFRAITNPTIGNHEYENGVAPGYFDYWDNVPNYYSYDYRGWHFISLNTNSIFNQTSPGKAQYNWLVNDLDSNTQPCTLVYHHQPYLNVGDEGPSTYLVDFWSLFAQHGVDLVINGHDHTYQRYQPLNGNGAYDPAGPTEIIVGSGGHALGGFPASDNRLVAKTAQYGALRLTLNSAGASYQFITTAGQTYDSGSVQCNTAQTDTSAPTVPDHVQATASYKTRIDLSWDPSSDNVGVTNYEISRDGQTLTTIANVTSYSDLTVTPGSTHSYTVRGLDAVGNRSAPSAAVSATTPTSAVLFKDGFEGGSLSKWTNSGLVTQQAQVFAGSWAAEGAATGGAGAFATHDTEVAESDLYYVTRFNILSQGANNINILRFRNNTASHNALATLFVSTTGKLGVRNDVAGAATTSSTSVSRNAWHTAQLHIHVTGTTSSTIETWLDGVPVTSLTGQNLGTNPIGRVELGETTTGRTFDVAFDEVAYDRQYIGDITGPTPPTNLAATAKSGLEVDLSWTAGTDDIGVTGYDVYRNGNLLTSIGGVTSYADKTVAPMTAYTYQLVAKDAAGNTSGPSQPASATTGRPFEDDFESGNLSHWTTVSGLSPQQTLVDTGTWAAEASSTGTAGASAQVTLDATVSEIYYKARFNLLSQGNNSVSLLRVRTSSNTAIGSAYVSTAGKLSYRNDTSGTFTTGTLTVTPNMWHEVLLHVLVNGASSQVEVSLDGQLSVSQTDSLGTAQLGRLELGDSSSGRTFDVAFDNVGADATFQQDAAPPTPPSNLHQVGATSSSATMAWDAARDNVGVVGYAIYRDGTSINRVGGSVLSYTDTTLSPTTTYRYAVVALDAADNASSPSNTIDVTTPQPTGDTTPPDTTIGASPANPTTALDASFSFSADDPGATFECSLDGNAFAACTSPKIYSVLGAGSHTFQVRAIDPAGNADPTPAAYTWTIDTTGPAVSLTAPADGATVNGTVTLSASSSDGSGVASVAFLVDGVTVGTATTSPYSVNWNSASLPDGQHSLTAHAVDTLGNATESSARSINLENFVPDTTITQQPATTTNLTSATFAFTSTEANVTFACKLDGAAFAACTSPRTYTGLANGNHTFQVRATDAAQKTDATPATFTWTIDGTAPTVSTVSPASGGSATATTAVTATFSENVNAATITSATFSLAQNGVAGTIAATISYDAATWVATLQPSSPLVGGATYTATVRGGSSGVQDLAGNRLASDKVWSFTVDAVAPTTTITSPANGASVTGKVTVTASASDDVRVVRVELYVDGQLIATDTSAPFSFAWNTKPLTKTQHTLQVKAYDAAGNVGTSGLITVTVR